MVDHTAGEFRPKRARDALLSLPRSYREETEEAAAPSPLRYAAGLAGLLLLAWLTLPALLTSGRAPSAGDDAAPALPAPAWQPAGTPPNFLLESPLFPREAISVESRRHQPGGGREDVFTAATPVAGGAFARIVVYRPGDEPRREGSFFLAMARLAAQAGYAVTRTEIPAGLMTRLGAAEASETEFLVDGQPRACLGFRLDMDGAGLNVSGWLCGAGARTDRTQLACLIDGLDLAPGVADLVMRAAFAGKSNACPAKPQAAPRRGV
ncbi:hypothetical protein NK718_09130 [Alsobacter sp. SYSU M60028]|uniref:Uncharacterized protein n=1 Tax=Alsobacter ponti TaxID=2962936 RepID=A0ABT1LD76_9HYPH|nr:hypothetical protein [Alsobacter ponti]MCP8938675.1 hypothetical protein [Alsobacter ponti]